MPAVDERQWPVPSIEETAGYDERGILRNEANLSFVSGPLSVVSGPLEVAGGEVEAIEEPGVPDDALAVDPAEATDNGQRTTDELVSSPLPVAGDAVEAIEHSGAMNVTAAEGARESFDAGCARIRRRREEDVRKLNEQARWQAEQAMAARRAHRRNQRSQASEPGDQPTEREAHRPDGTTENAAQQVMAPDESTRPRQRRPRRINQFLHSAMQVERADNGQLTIGH
jgi:hypothetical protein